MTSPPPARQFTHPVFPAPVGAPPEVTSPLWSGTRQLPRLVGAFGDSSTEPMLSDAFIDALTD
ncbi:hypothetical protein NGF19_21550 [Streptomyces sp. RY43-2]|uniref:Uncharacterized protein n=1 Tax=Streptomyces macrolidinus TaxID=2952607 RepID=A0ABT0ZIC5_9ACTN|nr:hypothetical protein [Streptomyces macrolidinus]MCN9243335.1 hypothetical protein [Streptomyces macrolidinus]